MISKPWCAFGGVLFDGVGKVVRDNPGSVEVMYTEGQIYPPALWDVRYVKRFETPEAAVAEACSWSSETTGEVIAIFLQNFPSVKTIDLSVVERCLFRIRNERRMSHGRK